MKRTVPVMLPLVMATMLLSGCCLSHEWYVATCEEPKTCSKCGETEGEALGHDWEDATCETPKTCSTCDKTKGNELGHDWCEATCTEPETCTRCAETRGETLEHELVNWMKDSNTCMSAKCRLCGEMVEAEIDHEILAMQDIRGKWTVIGVQFGGTSGEWEAYYSPDVWVEFDGNGGFESQVGDLHRDGVMEFTDYNEEYSCYWYRAEFDGGNCRFRLDDDGELYWVADNIWLCFEAA